MLGVPAFSTFMRTRMPAGYGLHTRSDILVAPVANGIVGTASLSLATTVVPAQTSPAFLITLAALVVLAAPTLAGPLAPPGCNEVPTTVEFSAPPKPVSTRGVVSSKVTKTVLVPVPVTNVMSSKK